MPVILVCVEVAWSRRCLFFDGHVTVVHELNGGKKIIVPPFVYLQEEELWKESDNIPFLKILGYYQDALLKAGKEILRVAYYDVLYMLKAYDEVKEHDEIILFIDELHTIVGAGAAEGAIDTANIMKPELARGDIQIIGATTLDEYKRYIEKDSALERRFQPINVEIPTRAKTIEILFGIKERYENYHQVCIEDSAIIAATDLSIRYIKVNCNILSYFLDFF